jgi:hypothetical protein
MFLTSSLLPPNDLPSSGRRTLHDCVNRADQPPVRSSRRLGNTDVKAYPSSIPGAGGGARRQR